jgi:hypothetical protein
MAKKSLRIKQQATPKFAVRAYTRVDFTEAILELKRAYLVRRMPQLLFDLARTYARVGDVDSERYFYKAYLADAPLDASNRRDVEAHLEGAGLARSLAPSVYRSLGTSLCELLWAEKKAAPNADGSSKFAMVDKLLARAKLVAFSPKTIDNLNFSAPGIRYTITRFLSFKRMFQPPFE